MSSQNNQRHSKKALAQELIEQYVHSFAHIIKLNQNKESIIGQAWLAGLNTLITCGHVVDDFLDKKDELLLRFPGSGNTYKIDEINLHPGFVRQQDKFVRYDLALLHCDLVHPELGAKPLPFSFEKQPDLHESLFCLRYPTHLTSLSSSPQPVAQSGKYLGLLRKHDQFHWLHDLALSPGDSGAAIFCGSEVVAVHCGDTASLPGLNLPTTAIRLCVWIDAIREFGLKATYCPPKQDDFKSKLKLALLTMALFCLTTTCFGFYYYQSAQKQWSVSSPELLPVDISLNKSLNGYNFGDEVQIALSPRSDCFLYLFNIDESKRVMLLYPPYGLSALVKAGQSRIIDRFGSNLLKVNQAKDKLCLVVLNSDLPLVNKSDWSSTNPASSPLSVNSDELINRINKLENADAINVWHLLMDAPRSTAP